MSNPREAGVAVLASGRIAYVNEDGSTELATCHWLVRVASGCPEPDSIEDTYREVECGLPRMAVGGNVEETTCDSGHHHVEYGSRTYVEGGWEARYAFEERHAEMSR